MKKTYLLTPGPTSIPERISAIFAQPIIHHRTPAFEKIFADCRAGLQAVFQTQQDVLMLACTGSGGMEAAVSNCFSAGDAVIVVKAGKFGERWTKIAQAYGLGVVELELPPGESIEPKVLAQTVSEHPEAKAVLFQASETSTGAAMPVQEICKIARAANMLAVCDAITACGVFDLRMDEWGIDVLITGSQKAFMLPPGLTMIALGDRAWAAAARSDLPKFYFNLSKEKKSQATNQTAWTPAISLIQGLQESLRMFREEGLQNVFKRHELLAQATRAGIKALGLEMLAKRMPSTAVTAVILPPAIVARGDGKKVVKIMRDKYGVTMVGGQDELDGKIIRMSHFGYCAQFDITTGLSALELALHELGHPVQFGQAVGAALKVFAGASS